ncbi:hypothetical protein CCP3SC5AM1_220020 [Gammaproteobacteria bacterium]
MLRFTLADGITAVTINQSIIRIVIQIIAIMYFVFYFGATGLAHATEVGTVTHLNGPLLATTDNGVKKILAPRSEINSGDTLITADNTYARIKFVDNGEVTLRPNTQFKVENFHYDDKNPEKSNAFFNLLKGGLRAITGFIGKHSANRDKYRITAASATIGIRGTIFGANNCQGGSCGHGIPDGLHVDVSKGTVVVSNALGSQELNAGQFGYVPSENSKPVILPADPGAKFTPPPTFTSKTNTGNGSSGSGKSGVSGGSCEVH